MLAGSAVATTGAARIALGWDSACAVLVSAGLGCSAAALAFHLLAPESRFPVVYRRKVQAHLRLDGSRKARVVEAVRDELGIVVADLQPYRLDGSAGSTPCRLVVEGDPPGALFGKLYATTHLRSDRWYKLSACSDTDDWRTRRRSPRCAGWSSTRTTCCGCCATAGCRCPTRSGWSRSCPEHEYLLVTELVDGAVEILHSGVADEVVDDALRQVRMLWQAGAAHRDIKPSNVLAQGGRVVLIDVSFGELRPSRWRQAVDLANMMLTLSLVAGPVHVLARAERFFDRDELAEAFAATSSLTVPRQLRRMIDEDGRDLPEEFRRLLPGPAAHPDPALEPAQGAPGAGHVRRRRPGRGARRAEPAWRGAAVSSPAGPSVPTLATVGPLPSADPAARLERPARREAVVNEQTPLPQGVAWRAVARCMATTAVLLARRRIHLPPRHVGTRLRFADGTAARVYRETVVDGAGPADPCVLVVEFRLRAVRGWGHALFRWESLLNTPLFVGFPGFVSKLWLAHDEHGVYRGLYEWDGPARAEAYARSLWRVLALVSVPRLDPLPGAARAAPRRAAGAAPC